MHTRDKDLPMRTVSDIFKSTHMPVSFEMVPPKGEFTGDQAHEVAGSLAPLRPDYISVTCSAGGSGNSDNTNIMAEMIQRDFEIPTVAHVTCINKDAASLEVTIADLKVRGIKSVLALRGDVPEGADYDPSADFAHATDLIGPLAQEGFCVGGAAYPEGHIDNLDADRDIMHLKMKQDAGASFLVTQLVFVNDTIYRFRERAEAAGITVPITCGIMPFLSKSQISRMVFMCGASLPSPIIKLLAKYEDDPESLRQAGIEYACTQLVDLAEHGADGLHVYTMNQAPIAEAAMKALADAGFRN